MRKILQDEQCLEIIRKKLRRDGRFLADGPRDPVEINGFLGQYYMLRAVLSRFGDPRLLHEDATAGQQPAMRLCSRVWFKEAALYAMFPVFLEMLDRYDKRCFLGLEKDVIVLEDPRSRTITR